MTVEERLHILTDFWSKEAEFELKRPFVQNEGRFTSEIVLHASPKTDLVFTVQIPLSYPLSNDAISIRFFCLNATGYRHMNADNSICLITPKNTNFHERLIEEARLLREWRDKYYVLEEVDDLYEYPIISFASNNSFSFTEPRDLMHSGQFGHFYAVRYSDNSVENFESKNYIIQKWDDNLCRFSRLIIDQPSMLKGLYYFLDHEPVNGRIVIDDWADLEPLISQRFKQELNSLATAKGLPDEVYLLLGYYLPGTAETHWICLIYNRRKAPIRSFRVAPGSYEYHFVNQQIRYCKTFNCSYDRFFGRGAVCENFQQKKILIIGAGAIGSALAKIVVRAGVRYLFVCDPDRVEPGNICRSEYGLKNICEPKWIALAKELVIISPFIETGHEEILTKTLDEPFRTNDKVKLEKYDLIIDCTSDMELAYYIDRLQLGRPVINLSISNEANELVCVVGERNIAAEKNILFGQLNGDQSLLFYEGTGCWSPTFRASYFDINSLLNLAVKNIDHMFRKERQLNSFVIRSYEEEGTFNLQTIDY